MTVNKTLSLTLYSYIYISLIWESFLPFPFMKLKGIEEALAYISKYLLITLISFEEIEEVFKSCTHFCTIGEANAFIEPYVEWF